MILNVSTNNFARTAFKFFEDALMEFSIPCMIRVDGGGEFNHNEKFMNSLTGELRCVRGKSVHNVRIERLWRDCREKVLDKYILLFRHMEICGVLDITDDVHLFALHYVYLKRILYDLKVWQKAHNNHPIRTEQNKTPQQLWIGGSLINKNLPSSAMRNLFGQTEHERREILQLFTERQNWEEPDNIKHVFSSIDTPLSPQETELLENSIDPLSLSTCNGIDIYGHVVNYIKGCLNS